VTKALADKLRAVQLDQLQVLTDEKKWPQAFDLATRLMEKYKDRKDTLVQTRVTQLIAASAGQAIAGQDFKKARQQLLLLENEFAHTKEIDALRGALRQKAQGLVDRAAALESEGSTRAAVALLESAESIYPQLPNLHDNILRLSKKYPVLYVGVHNLPEDVVPGLAYTDSEKQAVELQFESLVKLSYNAASGQHYERALAADMPKLGPLGRHFQLLRNAYWSDGKPVTATNVRNTVRLLSDRAWPGFIPEWADLMAYPDGVRVFTDQYHVDLTIRQGYIDPLSMMDFKILPESLTSPAKLGDFAKAPVASGPFKLKSQSEDEVVFVANQYYADREGKIGLPRIREIHFVISKEPAKEFETDQQGRLHLLLDLPTQRIKEVATLPGVLVTPPMHNRRIYFLAVNHRKSQLKSEPLRRAIAHAIDREKILNDVFRDGHPDLHRALNGPYPRNSWPCDQKLANDPFSLEKAKAQFERAKQERPVLSTITLKFPEDDPAVKLACELIQKQVQEIGITLKLAPLSRKQLHRDVEQDHNYDLAYYSWDFANESYWLWPMFDPAATGPGGRNFLGYQDDDLLSSYFHKTMAHRNFSVVKQLTHEIHARLDEKMPFIPLWQLDTQFAYHNSLTFPADIDPLLIFTDVENWKLEKR
ncbi:MAG TPA: ABC transporter substrate-binding protein, partial [Gemmataceae bacterium]|nr:ABC transporter substrate-binding protein [Gemmataceae bacterium]